MNSGNEGNEKVCLVLAGAGQHREDDPGQTI
jgi:hypothetical protein